MQEILTKYMYLYTNEINRIHKQPKCQYFNHPIVYTYITSLSNVFANFISGLSKNIKIIQAYAVVKEIYMLTQTNTVDINSSISSELLSNLVTQAPLNQSVLCAAFHLLLEFCSHFFMHSVFLPPHPSISLSSSIELHPLWRILLVMSHLITRIARPEFVLDLVGCHEVALL